MNDGEREREREREKENVTKRKNLHKYLLFLDLRYCRTNVYKTFWCDVFLSEIIAQLFVGR